MSAGRVGLSERGVVMVAPVLPEDVRQQAQALAESRLLELLVTGWVPASDRATRLLRGMGLAWVARREPLEVATPCIVRAARVELAQRWALASGRSDVDATDRRFSCTDRIAARHVDGCRVVIAREDGCLASFAAVNEYGGTAVLDLPNPYFGFVKELTDRELEAFPDTCSATSDPRVFDSDRMERKEAELAHADWILVPSSFAKRTLESRRGLRGRIRVLPFAGTLGSRADRVTGRRRPVILHVGQISMRKGVHRLLRAWKRLGAHRSCTLRLVGAMRLREGFLKDYRGLYEHVPHVPRVVLEGHYTEARALVLNSLAEGFGLVIPEAMSYGVPVLASRNSGAPDLVTHGEEGFLFDYGDDEALMAALDFVLTHPESARGMGQKAVSRIADRDWTRYRTEFSTWIGELAHAA